MRDDRTMAPTSPTFYFGAMSPYSWFSAERVDGLIADARWQPLFLGGIFKVNGRKSWGLDEHRAAGMADCEARADEYGLGPIRWPGQWPTSDLTVARAMLVADRKGLLKPFALAAMRLAFREGADLQQAAAVLEAAGRSGIDAEELRAALGEQDVKDALRAAGEQALARGVSGVPTVIVGEQLFWGDDRLEQAASAAAAGTTAA
jgi:2-hydroxychromene-2-carboxylate isomerase